MTPKCSICGKFCKVVDIAVPFGTYGDIDPPDDILYCQSCVDDEIKYHSESQTIPIYWLPPKWVGVVAQELGYVQVSIDGYPAWHKRDEPLKENMVIVQ